jgi:L-ascorbate metabolism protein UlaG (beta-lactamase superfamily)
MYALIPTQINITTETHYRDKRCMTMKLQLIRHATLWVQYAGVRFLIDPMFSDHWDDAAAAALSKSTPIFCQPNDNATFDDAGFTSVSMIDTYFTFKEVTVIRTSGQHGTGHIGQSMGIVSGFILKADGEPTVYIAGDTIWCDDVKQAMDVYQPDATIVNAGGARFTVGNRITMDADDVISLCRYAAYTKVVAVHMDTINHCLVTREDLQIRLAAEKLIDQVVIPQDGDWVCPNRL